MTKIKSKYLRGLLMILVSVIGAYFKIFALLLFIPLGLFFNRICFFVKLMVQSFQNEEVCNNYILSSVLRKLSA